MILDIIIIAISIIAFVRGWKKGLLWAIVSLIAVFVGIIVSLKFSHMLADFLFTKNITHSQYTVIICFVLLFIGTIFIFRTIIKLIEGILDTLFLGWANNLLGGVLYSFFALFLSSTFLWLIAKADLINPETKKSSKMYEYVQPLAPKTISVVTPYIPFFKTLYTDINNFFDKEKKETK